MPLCSDLFNTSTTRYNPHMHTHSLPAELPPPPYATDYTKQHKPTQNATLLRHIYNRRPYTPYYTITPHILSQTALTFTYTQLQTSSNHNKMPLCSDLFNTSRHIELPQPLPHPYTTHTTLHAQSSTPYPWIHHLILTS